MDDILGLATLRYFLIIPDLVAAQFKASEVVHSREEGGDGNYTNPRKTFVFLTIGNGYKINAQHDD